MSEDDIATTGAESAAAEAAAEADAQAVYVTVQPYESWESIAYAHNTTIEKLAILNEGRTSCGRCPISIVVGSQVRVA